VLGDDDEDEQDYGDVMLLLVDPDPLKDDRIVLCHAKRVGRVLMLQEVGGPPVLAIYQPPTRKKTGWN